MKFHQILIKSALLVLVYLSMADISFAQPIDLSVGTAAQSSTLDEYDASHALDGVSNFTHTTSTDDDPTWQVLLPTEKTFQEITLENRGGSGSWVTRLRDITVQVVVFNGNVNNDFNGGTVVYSSPLLNPNNVLGSPASITVDVGGVTGNMIRVIRTPGQAESHDSRALSLDEVTATGPGRIVSFAASTPVITPGDPILFHWEVSGSLTALTIDNGVGSVFSHTTDRFGTIQVNSGPAVATTYEITATDINGASTSATTIAVTDQPLIYSFSSDKGFLTTGTDVNLSWNVGGNATSLTLNGNNVLGSSGIIVSPTADTTYVLEASNANGTVTRAVSVKMIEPGVPVITEFMAENDSGVADTDGDRPDWIELHNPGTTPASLAGFHLTDDSTHLIKWVFPDVTMAPGSYLVIFASGKNKTDPAGELHTNFSLASDGEYLALVKPDGSTIVSEFSPTFPDQRSDISYGLSADTLNKGYFLTPTPSAANGTTIAGFVKDTSFSHDRGFYSSPVQLEISTATSGAQIRYTTDGSKPTVSTGQVYAAGTPITINRTTVVRAAAFKDQYEPTNIDTHTYIFKSDVIAGPNMDTDITQDPIYGPHLDSALTSIPSISLTFSGDLDYGEKEVAVELINFEDGHKQVDAGMERFGGYVTNFDKRSIRINFRSKYGPGKLNFDLFDNRDWKSFQPAEEYDAIELRAGNHDMSQRGAYLSNRYADDALLDMGQIAPHGRFVHVYLNGDYWGQYHLRERWNASMLSEYFGGDKDDYEAVNANDNFSADLTVYDGSGDFWAETETLVTGPAPFINARSHVDIIDEIDFILLYVNGRCESEFRAGGSRAQNVPFKFYLKDADGYLRNPTHAVTDDGPLDLMAKLADEADPDYEMLLADRIHKHYFNDGALTPARSIERLLFRVNETQLSILTECARWGYRSPSSWQSYQDNLINNQLPGQTATLIGKFISAGMYPDLAAPVYNQHGGTAPGVGPTIAVTDSALKVYYVFGPLDTNPDPYLNSLDPRLLGGGINPAATVINYDGTGGVPSNFVQTGDNWSYLDDGSNQGTAWRSKAFNDSAWSSGPSELGYGDGDEATEVSYVDVDPGSQGIQKNVTTYFRKSDINIPDPTQYDDFTINYWYDDAIAIYINGVEVERVNLDVNAAYDDFSTGTVNDNAFGSITVPSSRFTAGNNTIAVEIHQRSFTSSDITFNLNLRGNLPGSGQSGLVSDPVPVTASGWLLSRTYDPTTGAWSALNEAYFTPDPAAADASNLVVSEVNYHPADPSGPAELAITTDNDDFEFIELKNVSPVPVDLNGVSFTNGIDFTFGPYNVIPAGGRIVIVKNKAAFTERYDSWLSEVTFGSDSLGNSEYGGKLSNDGERVVLEDASGSVIHDFTYNDQLPWPTAADGESFSMVLISPVIPIPDHDVGTNWAASAQPGGYPGQTSPAGFVGDPEADNDGDGIKAIIEYALGTSDDNKLDTAYSATVDAYTLGEVSKDYLTISYQVNQHTRNVITVVAEISEDLITWDGVPELVLVSETDNGDGTYTVVYRSAKPVGQRPSGREFIRIRVSQQ